MAGAQGEGGKSSFFSRKSKESFRDETRWDERESSTNTFWALAHFLLLPSSVLWWRGGGGDYIRWNVGAMVLSPLICVVDVFTSSAKNSLLLAQTTKSVSINSWKIPRHALDAPTNTFFFLTSTERERENSHHYTFHHRPGAKNKWKVPLAPPPPPIGTNNRTSSHSHQGGKQGGREGGGELAL